jgi:prevent-host-death family protein
MKTYSVAEAKAKFSEVLELAASGEEVLVTKHGIQVARIVPPTPQGSKPVGDYSAARRLMKPSKVTSAQLVREDRDAGY